MSTEPTSPSQGTDLLAVLTAIRPDTKIDRLGDAEQRTEMRSRITSEGGDDELVRRRRRRHRPLVGLAATALVLTGGVGAAAAGGLMPQAFLDAFSGWQDFPAEGGSRTVDPATAERAATAGGPDGTVFSVVTASAVDAPGYICTVALFETQASAALPGPGEFTEASGNGCTAQPTDGAFGSGVNVDATDGYYVWWTPAGDAVRGELTTSSGSTYPVVLVDGNLYGWFPAPTAEEPSPELIGYAADGTEVGRTTV